MNEADAATEAEADTDTAATGARRPSVGVVVATRDRPELLERAIGSVLGQRYHGRVEVLVVFDQCDPDPSLSFDDGADRAVRVLTNARSAGLAGARNTGVLAADDHELLAFCDDDDLWSPGKLDAQVALLAAHPDIDVATTGLFIQAHGRITTRVLEHERILFTDLLRSRVMEAHPSTYLMRRAAVLGPSGDGSDGIGLVDEELPGSYAEDYDWLLRAARRADIGAVRLPLVKVVWHRSSFFAERWETIVAALDHLLATHPEIATEPVGLARIEGQQAFALASLGRRREAGRRARQALGHNRSEKRAWLALALCTGVVRSDQVLRVIQMFGRGI